MYKYRPEIDGLRAVAVMAVVFAHAGFPFIAGGYLGVDVFFVISGFLITNILLKSLADSSFSLVVFYERRARRILPALFLILAVSTVLAWFIMLPTPLVEYAKSLLGVVTFLSNYFFWIGEADYFATLTAYNPLMHTWSLSVEEQYYIIFPLLLMCLWKKFSRYLFSLLVAISVFSLVLAEFGWRNFPTANYYFLFTRAWELLIGSLLAFYVTRAVLPVRDKRVSNILSFVGLMMLIFGLVAFDEHTNVPSMVILIPTIGAGLIILFSVEGTFVYKTLSNSILVKIGVISYSVYLWHQVVFSFAKISFARDPSILLYCGLIVFTLFLSYLSWRFVEQPFRDASRFSQRFVFLSSFCGILAFSLFSIYVVTEKGVPTRLPGNVQQELLAIDNVQSGRSDLVGYGSCHWYDKIVPGTVKEFYGQWSCGGERSNGGIVVLGDSHAADKAISFRLAGLEVGQLTGAGCSLRRAFMSKDCAFMFDSFIADAKSSDDINIIVLANRFNEYELSDNALADIVAYWGKANKPIVIFSSMVEVPYFKEQAAKLSSLSGTEASVGSYTVDMFRSNASAELLERNESVLGYHFINSGKIFCSLSTQRNCQPVSGEQYLLADNSHLSVVGAREFGKETSQIVKKIVAEVSGIK